MFLLSSGLGNAGPVDEEQFILQNARHPQPRKMSFSSFIFNLALSFWLLDTQQMERTLKAEMQQKYGNEEVKANSFRPKVYSITIIPKRHRVCIWKIESVSLMSFLMASITLSLPFKEQKRRQSLTLTAIPSQFHMPQGYGPAS